MKKLHVAALFSLTLATSLCTAGAGFAIPERDLLGDAKAAGGSISPSSSTSSSSEFLAAELAQEAELLKALEGASAKANQVESDTRGAMNQKSVKNAVQNSDDTLGLVPVSAAVEDHITSSDIALDQVTSTTNPKVKNLSNELQATDKKLSEMELSIAQQMAALESQAKSSGTLDHDALSFEDRIKEVNRTLLNELMVPENSSEGISAASVTAPSTQPGSEVIKGGIAAVDRGPSTPSTVTAATVPESSGSASGKSSSLMQGIERLEGENRSLRSQLADLRNRNRSHEDMLKKSQARLLLAETEVERLARLLEARGLAVRVSTAPRSMGATLNSSTPTHSAQSYPQSELVKTTSLTRGDPIRSDMPIATVAVDKANLRAGPSLKDSVLMSVSRGSRLVVERREGDWLQVLTPANTRAYIAGDMVVFQTSNPDSAVRVRASRESGYARQGDTFKLTSR